MIAVVAARPDGQQVVTFFRATQRDYVDQRVRRGVLQYGGGKDEERAGPPS